VRSKFRSVVVSVIEPAVAPGITWVPSWVGGIPFCRVALSARRMNTIIDPAVIKAAGLRETQSGIGAGGRREGDPANVIYVCQDVCNGRPLCIVECFKAVDGVVSRILVSRYRKRIGHLQRWKDRDPLITPKQSVNVGVSGELNSRRHGTLL
jgi:hypothetical protein